MGLAFGRIRELRLYLNEFDTFETYCRDKWQYGRDYVDRLIAAAQVFTDLLTNCQEIKPEHESPGQAIDWPEARAGETGMASSPWARKFSVPRWLANRSIHTR